MDPRCRLVLRTRHGAPTDPFRRPCFPPLQNPCVAADGADDDAASDVMLHVRVGRELRRPSCRVTPRPLPRTGTRLTATQHTEGPRDATPYHWITACISCDRAV